MVGKYYVDHGKSLVQAVNFVLANPLYNVRWVRKKGLWSVFSRRYEGPVLVLQVFNTARGSLTQVLQRSPVLVVVQASRWNTRRCWCQRSAEVRCRRWKRPKDDSCIFDRSYFFDVHPAPEMNKQQPTSPKAHSTYLVEKTIHFWRFCAGWEAVRERLT